MKKTVLLLFVLCLCWGTGCAMLDGLVKTSVSDGDARMNLPEYKGLKHAVGCKDFENQSGWFGHWDLGRNLSIMLESALYDTGRFVIVEREKLKDVIAEQDLVASGRTAKATKVAKTGVLRPAKYLATGAITVAEESTSGGRGGISVGGVRIGGGAGTATITIIAKLVDTTTGEIVQKKTIIGKAGRVNFNVGLRLGSVSSDLGAFAKSPMGSAAQDCINQAAKFFAEAMAKIPFDAAVVKVSDGRIIINRGTEHGVEEGMEMVMRHEGEMLTDPDTGEILGREEGKVLGRLKVTKVQEKISYCEVLEGEKNPPVGTLVTSR